MSNNELDTLAQLIKLVAQSYDPEQGCQWLKNKDFNEIVQYSLEEVYELIDAIKQNDKTHIKEELADLAYHLVIYAELGKQKGWFNLNDVLQTTITKLKNRRNWEQMNALSAEQARAYWQQRKQQEKPANASLLANITHNMPAILTAQKIQEEVAGVGFDWPDVSSVLTKLKEEIQEFEQAYQARDVPHIQEELGDLLFVLINLVRKCHLNAEHCLRDANKKFSKQFNYIEQHAQALGKALNEIDIEQLEVWWQQSKSKD